MVSANAMSRRRVADRRWIAVAAVVTVALLAWLTHRWWPGASDGSTGNADTTEFAHDVAGEHGDHHQHGVAEASSITLSERGLKNIGFRPVTVNLQAFEKTVSMPAIVAEKPGQTQLRLASPVGGVLTEIHVVQGEAIQPGSKVFEVRLTHEELVAAQQDYLQTAESLEVVDREIARLQSLGEVIAGKRIFEQQYEKQKLEAALQAAQQALLLHGLTDEQVAEIRTTRQLLRSLVVYAPVHSHAGDSCKEEHTFHVQRLSVSRGQQVETSQEMAILADHCELYVQGRAFEDDVSGLREATREGWSVSARLMSQQGETDEIGGLKLLYLADTIDSQTRAFPFYLRLPNEIVFDQTNSDNHRFIEWKFKPGQRLELNVPVERWDKRIVLPVEAVVEETAEIYVYRQNGNAFERVPVHVEYRDNRWVVIANDGALFPGDVLAGRGAYQMHLALKNHAGGGIDPHAGHNH